MWRACLPLFKSEPSAPVHQHLWETLLALWDLGSRHKRRGRFDRKGKDAPPLSHWGPPWLGVREWAASLPQVSAPHQAGSVWPHKPGCRRIGSLVNAGKANNFNENKYNRYHMNTTQNTTELQGCSDASHHSILASFLSKVLVSGHQRHGTASFPHGRGRNQGPRTRPPLSSCPHPPDEWLWGDFAGCSVPHAQGSGALHPAVACDVISDSYSSKTQSNNSQWNHQRGCTVTTAIVRPPSWALYSRLTQRSLVALRLHPTPTPY